MAAGEEFNEMTRPRLMRDRSLEASILGRERVAYLWLE